MNKPYFAKYLPVEAEIKQGDIVKSNGYYCPVVKVLHEGNVEVIGIPKIVSNVQKVKLFLCSRDIQVGDKVILESHPDFGEKTITGNDNKLVSLSDGSKTHDHNLIKVIGEISPDATWIKDGDEFEESDIDHGGWVDEDLKTILIKIKGPCKHFH